MRPDFLLPYNVHCAADCLGVPEVLTEGGKHPGPLELSLRTMAAYDEITGSCDRRTCRTVISGLKSRAASTVTALKWFLQLTAIGFLVTTDRLIPDHKTTMVFL